jgi:Family of unknown function (DUF5372)
VRVTHPFHPLAGRQLVCVGERYNRYGVRLLLRVDDDHLCSVLPQWTDVVAADPEVVLGDSRGLLRVADLLGLADLVSRLVERQQQAHVRKGNDAAHVTQTLPHTTLHADDQGVHCLDERARVVSRALDDSVDSGVVVVTTTPEVPCRSDATAKTRRPHHSRKRER